MSRNQNDEISIFILLRVQGDIGKWSLSKLQVGHLLTYRPYYICISDGAAVNLAYGHDGAEIP